MSATPPAAFRSMSTDALSEAPSEFDPLRICIFTTIALISWIVTPPLAMATFGTAGVFAYWRARRRGLAKSRCVLGDTRVVIGYLAVLAAVGAAATVLRFT